MLNVCMSVCFGKFHFTLYSVNAQCSHIFRCICCKDLWPWEKVDWFVYIPGPGQSGLWNQPVGVVMHWTEGQACFLLPRGEMELKWDQLGCCRWVRCGDFSGWCWGWVRCNDFGGWLVVTTDVLPSPPRNTRTRARAGCTDRWVTEERGRRD